MASAPVAATAAISTSPPSDERQTRPDGAPDPASAVGQTSSTPAPAHFSGRADANEGGTNHTNDGRVKNPVPSKLKGMADNKNGNFGVMHIDISSSQAAYRNAAAKRTSEETEAAARLANMRGYQSIKRSKLAWNPTSDQHSPLILPTGNPTITPAPAPAPAPAPSSGTPMPMTPHGLSNPSDTPAPISAPAHIGTVPHDTKIEQARLLTLLRSLNPVVVVDQLCKALAYFGGIPGAPPPNDNLFPESAKNNGQGSLFIGWVAEIFPPVEGSPTTTPSQPSTQHLQPSPATPATPAAVTLAPMPASAPPSVAPPALPPLPPPPPSSTAISADVTTTPIGPFKRPRGRPKGSKGTKNRKDKGARKSDIATPAPELTSLVGTSNPLQAGQGRSMNAGLSSSSDQLPDFMTIDSMTQHDPDSSIVGTPGTGKKRGRPKGSKNRPKNNTEATQNGSDASHPSFLTSSGVINSSSHSPLLQKTNEGYINLTPTENGLHRGPESRRFSPTKTAPKDTPEQPTSVGSQHHSVHDSAFTSATVGWPGTGLQLPGSRPQPMNTGNQAATKRKMDEPVQSGDLEFLLGKPETSPRIHQQQDNSMVQNSLSEQAMNGKRRRVSNEIHQSPLGFGTVDSHSPRVGMAASPVINNGFHGVPQSLATATFDTQIPGTRKLLNQHLHHPSQQNTQTQSTQNHQFSTQKLQHPPIIRSRPQQQQMQMPLAGARQRNQAPLYSATSTSISQSYYAQHRQVPSPMGQVTNSSNGFGRGGSAQSAAQFSSGMARQGSNDSNVVNIVQQGAVASARSQQGQSAGRQPTSFTNQQVPSSSAPASSLSQFQGFGDQNYLEMDYSLDRDVQDAAAAFGDSHLEAALVEPNMRERLYHAMSRR